MKSFEFGKEFHRRDDQALLSIAKRAIEQSLASAGEPSGWSERDWQAQILEQLDRSAAMTAAGLRAYCELRAHWKQKPAGDYNPRVDIALIDKAKLVPVLVMELKAVARPSLMKEVAQKDLAKLRGLDFQVFDDAPVKPVLVAVSISEERRRHGDDLQARQRWSGDRLRRSPSASV